MTIVKPISDITGFKALALCAGLFLFFSLTSVDAAELDLSTNENVKELDTRQNLNDFDITYYLSEASKKSFNTGSSSLISSGEQCGLVLAKFKMDPSSAKDSGLDVVLADSESGDRTKVSFVADSKDEVALNYQYNASSDGEPVQISQELNRLDAGNDVYLIMKRIDDERISIGATNVWPDENNDVKIRFFKTPLTANYESIDFINNDANLAVEDISFYNCEGKLPGDFVTASRKTNKQSIYY